jgi:TPR repeat protein
MEPSTTISKSITSSISDGNTLSSARTSEIQGSLLLTNATMLLFGAWTSLALAALPLRALAPEDADAAQRRHPLMLEEYDVGCQSGNLDACNDLGVAYQRGYGTEPDSDVALDIFARACRGGHAEACSNQGALLERAWQQGADITPVVDAYSRACSRGAGLGCSNLGALYAVGKGVAPHRASATWYFERACQLGSAIGCENQAVLLEEEAASQRRPIP